MRVEPSSGNCGGGGRSNDIGMTSRECGWIDVAEQPLHAVVPAEAKRLGTSAVRHGVTVRLPDIEDVARHCVAVADWAESSDGVSDPIDHCTCCDADDRETG